jgi:GR25 family glycosyltransferase involved in LPS biosynthesis
MDKIPFVACINLKSRPDRLHHSKEQFKRASIDNVYYHIVDKSPKGGRYGCYESHLAVYKKALGQGQKYALIFEDDFIINVDDVNLALSRAFRCMKIDRKWNIIKLQATGVIDIVECVDDGIFRCNVLHTRCYMISKRAMKRFVKLGITQNHIDLEQTVQLENKIFVVKPGIISDAGFTSDNNHVDKYSDIVTKLYCYVPQWEHLWSELHFHSPTLCWLNKQNEFKKKYIKTT